MVEKRIAAIFRKAPPDDAFSFETTRSITGWHHNLRFVSGGLVIAMGAKVLSRRDLNEWVKMLREIADEMEAFAKGK
jgi:hypothetical protein